MIRDERITPVQSGEFRTKLDIDSVYINGGYAVDIISQNMTKETIFIFTDDPIICPTMSYMYSLKVSNVNDRFFKQAVSDYTYLNPSIDNKGLYLMAENIQKLLVVKDKEHSKPLIGINNVFKEVKRLHKIFESDDSIEIPSDVVIIYEKDSKLSKEEKMNFSRATRTVRDHILKGEVIHNKAQMMVEEIKSYATSKRDVYNEVRTYKGLSSYNTFNQIILDKTVTLLDNDLKTKMVKSEKEYKKLLKYNELRKQGKTTNEALKLSRIGMSTAVKFNAIIKKVDNGELLIEL